MRSLRIGQPLGYGSRPTIVRLRSRENQLATIFREELADTTKYGLELYKGAALALQMIEEGCQCRKLLTAAHSVPVRAVIYRGLMCWTPDVLS